MLAECVPEWWEVMEMAAEIEKVQAEVRQEQVQLDISDERAYKVGDND